MIVLQPLGIDLKVSNCRIVTLCLSTVLAQISLTVATKCLRDEALGDSYEANVYYCEDEDKPECCEVEESATCCETKSGKNFREQFQLWGILGVAIVLIAFVVVCWRKDTYLCEGDTIKERCENSCRKRKKSSDDDKGVKIKVNKPKNSPEKKYNPENSNKPHSALSSQRGSTSLTATNIDPMFTSHNEIHISDVDSGRGSVASSASHLTRANEKMQQEIKAEGNGNKGGGSGHAAADILIVQPIQREFSREMERGGGVGVEEMEMKHVKKHKKSKKKSKSKDKDQDSDNDEMMEQSAKKDRSSSKKKKKRSRHGSHSEDTETTEMDVLSV